MNNPNNQLSVERINQQTVSNFEQAIKNESTISDKFYNEHIWNDGWFKQYWEYHLRTHYEEFLRSNQLFSYQDYGFNNQVACHNLASIRDFALQIEKDVKQALLTQVESLINSQANAYVRLIETKETTYHLKALGLNHQIQDKDSLLETNSREIQELTNKLLDLENQLAEFQDKFKTNWQEIYHHQRKSLTDNQHFLNKSLAELTNQFANLESQNFTKEEKIAYLRQSIKELTAFCDVYDKNLEELQNQVKNQDELLMYANNNQLAQEAENIRLNSVISRLEIRINSLEQEKQATIENNELFLADMQKQLDNYVKTQGECLQLEKANSQLHIDKQELNQQITDLNQSLSQLQAQHQESLNVFNFEKQRLTEQINQLDKKAYWTKVKLMSVLALDTTRNFLPKKKVLGWDIQQTITNIETALFASEVVDKGQVFTWTIFGIFSISIWLFGLWKITALTFHRAINLYQRLKGSGQDLADEVGNDIKGMKDAYRYRQNYSQSDLRKSQNNYQNIPDDDYIVNNKAFAQENKTLTIKSTQPKKILKKTQ